MYVDHAAITICIKMFDKVKLSNFEKVKKVLPYFFQYISETLYPTTVEFDTLLN